MPLYGTSSLRVWGVKHFIGRNGVTHSSHTSEGVTNCKKRERAISLGLLEMVLKQQKVVVNESDVNLFVLLLAHYDSLQC